MNKNNKIKLTIAITGLMAAGAVLAWQFLPSSLASDSSKAPTKEEIITTKTKDGSVITKQGGRAMREPPPK